MDLAALKIFQAVVEHGGVNRAAAKLHRVPSNVTTRIKQLEEELGIKLFAREGRTLALSNEGRALLPLANQLLRLAAEAEAAMKKGEPQGILRIGALESTSAARLPPILSRYHSLFPEVHIELVTGTSGALVGRLARQEIDAAFVAEPFNDDGLDMQLAFVEQLVLITPRSLRRIRTPKDIGTRTLISFATGCSYRSRLETWLGAERVHVDRVIECQSYPAIVACVAAGTGIAVVPRSIIEQAIGKRDVTVTNLPDSISVTQIQLAWRRNYHCVALEAMKKMIVAPRRKVGVRASA
jgi:DNA-binding transcriptional LysR family regulator